MRPQLVRTTVNHTAIAATMAIQAIDDKNSSLTIGCSQRQGALLSPSTSQRGVRCRMNSGCFPDVRRQSCNPFPAQWTPSRVSIL